MKRPLVIISGQQTPDTLGALEQAVLDRCRARGLDCLLVPHLYHVAESNHLWKRLAEQAARDSVLFCWLHPRPAAWILRRHSIGTGALVVLNLGTFPDAGAAVAAAVDALQNASHAPNERAASGEDLSPGAIESFPEATRPRWYPVIDGSRCVNCQHCLQFCLFGVYEHDSQGQVVVQNPDQCKPGCPACSRICPQSAIMFPLHDRDAAIAGAPGRLVVLDAAARRMFYAQTRQPCPVCGTRADLKARIAAQSRLCPECGYPQPEQPVAAGAAASTERPPFDDLDDLVDRLEQQMQRRG
jgi:Pyruvate/2-oxoacid:ferredoxin oxidoreductase delta subunit